MKLLVQLMRENPDAVLTCLVDDEAPHEWCRWTAVTKEIWKAHTGFSETHQDYRGKVIEQIRKCGICNKIELDVQG